MGAAPSRFPPVRWSAPPRVADAGRLAAFREALGVSDVIARILWNRGYRDAATARAFLQPRLDGLLDPAGLRGMAAAAGRIHEAIRRGEPVWIYGDYDVDGSTATALLLNFFRAAGVPVRSYIPHRVAEGYGLNTEALRAIAAEGGRVVVTVDTGISAVREAAAAKALGIDLIVTDHHEPPRVLPDAYAIVNPRQPGCAYPEKGLAGVGLAFKLAWAVAQGLSGEKKVSPPLREFLLDALGLVALGTVSDMAPLVGENRILASFGLSALARSRHPGIRALREICRFPSDRLSARDIGFGMGPRINAGGRIGQPDLGARLLSTTSEAEAVEIARLLDEQNRERQRIERRMLESVLARVASEQDGRWTLVLGDAAWHQGVVGIVAARLVDRFHRPAIVISWLDAPDGGAGTGKGSGRSIPGFHLVEALRACEADLIAYGGHARAAGVTIARERFVAFADRFDRVARDRLTPEDFVPQVLIEAETSFDQVTPALLGEIDQMAPFGIGNPRPVFATAHAVPVGSRRRLWGTRFQCFLKDGDAVRVAIGPEPIVSAFENGAPVDVAYTVKRAYRDPEGVELEIQAARPAAPEPRPSALTPASAARPARPLRR